MTDLPSKSGINEIPALNSNFFKWSKGLLASLVIITLAIIIINYKPQLALLSLAILIGLLLMFSPRVSFYLFLISISFFLPYRFTDLFVLYPFDIMMSIVFMGMVFDFMLNSRTEIRPALFDLAFLILIFATLVSASFAYNPYYSVIPSIRMIVIYFCFRVVFKYALEFGVRRIVLFYIYIVFFNSLYNIVLFVMQSGQSRIFGSSWLSFETLSMTALPMAFVFLIWAKDSLERFKYIIICFVIGIGILATQSRAPILAVVITIPTLIIFSTIKAKREKTIQPLKTMNKIFIPLSILGILILVLGGTLFAGALERYENFITSFTKPQGTIALRIVLWKTAIKAFLDNPITGIGIGNFKIIHHIYPELRLVPYWLTVKGMSVHNVILHYLAETGLIGSLALTVLAFKGLKTGYNSFRKNMNAQDNQVSGALFISMFVFCLTILYMRAWTWGQDGYIMAILFGLNAAWFYKGQKNNQLQN